MREACMKIAPLLRSIILLLILGLTAVSVPAQETMRVAIALFPTTAVPLLVGNDKGFFQKEGLIVEPIRISSAPTGLLPSHSQGAEIITVGSWDKPCTLHLGDAGKNHRYPRVARKKNRD